MFFIKKGFTLVEMMVAILLSAIVIFFSYTMTISAYKMFSKTSKTAKNFNNVQFFEEILKKSITESNRINIEEGKITCERYDTHLNRQVIDTYTFSPASDAKFIEQYGSHFDAYPSNIGNSNMFAPRELHLRSVPEGTSESSSPDILVLNNVRAFFYRPNKMGAGNHLGNIMIGIVYEDSVVPGVTKRQNRTFCFTMRNQDGIILKNGSPVL